MTSRVSHTTFDSLDADAMSAFRGGVLGFGQDPDDPDEPGHEECTISSPDGSQRLLFIEVVDATSASCATTPSAPAQRLPQRRPASQVLVDMDVLIAPADEDRLARAVRASVASAADGAALGPVRWGAASGGEDLLRQWDVEQGGAPLDGRRVRRLTMSVHAQGAADLLEGIVWAAIDAVCPTAREERRRLDAGETAAPAAPDRYPWASATRTADEVC